MYALLFIKTLLNFKCNFENNKILIKFKFYIFKILWLKEIFLIYFNIFEVFKILEILI